MHSMKLTRMQRFHSWLGVKSESYLFGGVGIGILIIFLILLFSLGCATSDVAKAKKAALISKETAEAAYTSIYLEFNAGRVSADDMQKADNIYDQWRMAQLALIAGIQAADAGSTADIETLSVQLAKLSSRLAQLALELQGEVIEDGN